MKLKRVFDNADLSHRDDSGYGIGKEVVAAGVEVLGCSSRGDDGRFALAFGSFDWGSDYVQTFRRDDAG